MKLKNNILLPVEDRDDLGFIEERYKNRNLHIAYIKSS